MPVTIRPAGVVKSEAAGYGRMAFVGSDLIAVLLEVEGQNPEIPRWSIDWIAPGVNGRPPPLFTQLEAARVWLSHRYRTSQGRLHHGSH